jgi:hypothetical protein
MWPGLEPFWMPRRRVAVGDKWTFAGLMENPFLAGLFGGLLALRGVPGATFMQRFFTVISACILAGFMTPAVSEYFGIGSESMRSGVAFLIGLFGLNLVSAGTDYIKTLDLKSVLPWGKK